MFYCIILLYIIYQHQSDPETSDITWKHTKIKSEKIFKTFHGPQNSGILSVRYREI